MCLLQDCPQEPSPSQIHFLFQSNLRFLLYTALIAKEELLMSIQTFKRLEKKYQLQTDQYEALLPLLEQYMEHDPFCPDGAFYEIYNIYYDTDDYRLIRASLQKPYYKEKLRLRSYQPMSAANIPVFLELKKKVGGIVSKRRASLSWQEADRFMEMHKLPNTEQFLNRQVLEEISWIQTCQKLTPAASISYRRTAWFGKEDPDFRITFDSEILAGDLRSCQPTGFIQADTESSSSASDFCRKQDVSSPVSLLPPDTFLMEVKITGAAPLWLANALTSLSIKPVSFSKYGTMYKTMICTKSEIQRVG